MKKKCIYITKQSAERRDFTSQNAQKMPIYRQFVSEDSENIFKSIKNLETTIQNLKKFKVKPIFIKSDLQTRTCFKSLRNLPSSTKTKTEIFQTSSQREIFKNINCSLMNHFNLFNQFVLPNQTPSCRINENQNAFNRSPGFQSKNAENQDKNFKYLTWIQSTSFTGKYLKNLKEFLKKLYSYQPIDREDVESLNPGQKMVLKILIKSKNFLLKHPIMDNLYLKTSNFQIWQQIHRRKSKSENLKFALDSIFEHLQQIFQSTQINLSNKRASRYSNMIDAEIYFFIHFFGHLEFKMNDHQLKEAFEEKLIPRNKLWKKFEKYGLKGISNKACYHRKHTKLQNYFKTLTRSQIFVQFVLKFLADCITFMGYCLNNDWDDYQPNMPGAFLEQIGINFLKTLAKKNRIQVNGLFRNWENQLINKNSYIGLDCGSSIRDAMKVIKECVKRKNLKLPWTFIEVRNSLVDCFINFILHLKPESDIKENTKSDYIRLDKEINLNKNQNLKQNLLQQKIKKIKEKFKEGTTLDFFLMSTLNSHLLPDCKVRFKLNPFDAQNIQQYLVKNSTRILSTTVGHEVVSTIMINTILSSKSIKIIDSQSRQELAFFQQNSFESMPQ